MKYILILFIHFCLVAQAFAQPQEKGNKINVDKSMNLYLESTHILILKYDKSRFKAEYESEGMSLSNFFEDQFIVECQCKGVMKSKFVWIDDGFLRRNTILLESLNESNDEVRPLSKGDILLVYFRLKESDEFLNSEESTKEYKDNTILEYKGVERSEILKVFLVSSVLNRN